eukprot:scaffold2799_cov159-Ochromonas_danica.AAC.37
MKDVVMSVGFGIAIGALIVAFIPKGAAHDKEGHLIHPPTSPSSTSSNTSTSTPAPNFATTAAQERYETEQKAILSIISRKPKLQKFFGVNDHRPTALQVLSSKPHLQKFFGVTVASNEANSTFEEESCSAEDLPESSPKYVFISSCLFVAAGAAGLGLANYFSNGDFGRLLVGIFPSEIETLGLTNFLNTYHVR